ncbi:MAG: ComF family protein [Lachnospiraceae bacterium]|nr:ComF family protein [Lachnospiraceae bacterium]
MTEWLYPERCPVCFKIVLPKGAMLHPGCRQKLEFLKEPVCRKCGRSVETEEAEYCPDCAEGTDRGWKEGRSIFPYHGVMERALWQVKREGTKEFVRFFGIQMYQKQKDFIHRRKTECIVPVPLHPSKQRSRGFNQAELLAAVLGQEAGLPVRRLLKKTRKTRDQKSLGRMERRKNLRNAFAVDLEELGENIPKSVLLVDDVSTTGSTLTACAFALRKQGVKQVVFLTVCAGELSG